MNGSVAVERWDIRASTVFVWGERIIRVTYMSKLVKFHNCKVCHTQVPVKDWESHKDMETRQIDAFPDLPRVEKPKFKRPRKELA
jgi:hypothetical protein